MDYAADNFAFTEPRYEPDQVRAWFADTAEKAPEILAPLHILLPILKRRIGPIGKGGEIKPKEGETGPRYPFRKIEDILNEGHGPLCDLGISWRKVAVVRHELTANGKAEKCVMEVVYELVGPLGDTVRTVAVGEAVDFGSDKATNKADTCARKNMLVDLLQLATEDPDSERPDRLDERPEVQAAPARDAIAAVDRVKALSDEGKAQVKDWAEERGIKVTPRTLTVGDMRKLNALVASIEKREKELAEAEGDTVQAAVDKLEDAVERAKEARSRHPQPPSAPAAPNGEAATDAAGDLDAFSDEVDMVTDQHVETLKREAAKLDNDQRAQLMEWAKGAGINVNVPDLHLLTVDQFTAVMTAMRNQSKARTVGTAKKAAGRPAKAAAKKAPAAPPVDEAALAARQALRAELTGRAELLPADLQDAFLSELAAADGPAGMSIGDAIQECPPAWDRWLERAVERQEALVPDMFEEDQPELSEAEAAEQAAASGTEADVDRF